MDGARLDALLTAGAAAWPGVAVDREAFAAHVDEKQAVEGAGRTLHTHDLYLAVALMRGLPAAIMAFDGACASVIDRACAASGATPAEVTELRQVVRARLLVPPKVGTAAIATYSGRAPLASWVRVVATREAARLLAKERREVSADDDDLGRLVVPDDDPEVGYLKRLYRAEFKAAFAAAVEALEDKQRLLLRQNMLDRLSIDALATHHGVHRATVARWVDAAREGVLVGTRRELLRRLQITTGELESIMRLIASQLDVSLPAALKSD